MKPSKPIIHFLAAFAVASVAANAATINLDLTSSNTGGIVLDAGANDFSFASFDVDYLIVGGGGSGGGVNAANRAGGGGGAGGLRTGATSITGAQSITVGAGGVVGVVTGSGAGIGTNGGNSVAFGLTATGGGAGGTNSTTAGVAGGSGGGASSRSASGGAASPVVSPAQGNNGAGGVDGDRAGGGGGAGGAGTGLTGGIGASSSITGSAVTYATGGSGGDISPGTAVGVGATAAANTGNGGGGGFRNATASPAGTSNTSIGGNGGSGIVVASYAGTTQLLSGGIVSTVGGKTIHTFNSSGSLNLHSATINGNISGTGGNLLWDKTGTLTLGGNNTYTGTTTVSLGTVSLFGLIASTSDLAIALAGNLFLGSTGVINVLQANYSLADANSDITGGRITGADTLEVTTFNNGSNDFTRISVIPEPSAALLGAIGLLGLLRRRR